MRQHLVAGLLHAAFYDLCNAELARDGLEIVRMTLVFLGRRARDPFSSRMSASLVRIMSCMPLAKYSLSLSALRFSNGSTTIDRSIGVSPGFATPRIQTRNADDVAALQFAQKPHGVLPAVGG